MLHETDGSDSGIQPLRRPDTVSLLEWRTDPVLAALPEQFALSRARGRPLILAVAGVFVGLVVLIALGYDEIRAWLYDGDGGVIQPPGELPYLMDAETAPNVVIGATLVILIGGAAALIYHWRGSAARWQHLETGRRLHTRRRFVAGGIDAAAALHTSIRAGDLSSLPTFTASRRGTIRLTTHTDSSDKQVFLTIALGAGDHLVAAPLIALRGPEATRFGLTDRPAATPTQTP